MFLCKLFYVCPWIYDVPVLGNLLWHLHSFMCPEYYPRGNLKALKYAVIGFMRDLKREELRFIIYAALGI